MTASDFQVLIAPIIGTIAAIAIALLSLSFTLWQERRYVQLRAAQKARSDVNTEKMRLDALATSNNLSP